MANNFAFVDIYLLYMMHEHAAISDNGEIMGIQDSLVIISYNGQKNIKLNQKLIINKQYIFKLTDKCLIYSNEK